METNLNIDEKKPLVLLIDDIIDNISFIEIILKKKGFDVAIASNGIEGLDFIKNTIPDLVLLDIMMPEMDGFEVCRQIKANPKTKDIPVIFLTSKNESDDIIKGFENGGHDYIIKPFNVAELVARVTTHISLKIANDNNKDYINLLTEKNNKLSVAEAELQFLKSSKDVVDNVISSDLRNYIKVINGISSLLKDQCTIESTSFELKETSKKLSLSTKHIHRVVDNLYVWSHIKKSDFVFKPISLNTLNTITALIDQYLEQIESKNLIVTLDINDDFYLKFDPDLFEIISNNLLSNALKYSYPGKTISIKSYQDGGFSYLVFKDEGIGMSNNEIEMLFKSEIHKSVDGTNGECGAGLGLLICKELIEMNDGSLLIESDKNSGSTFTVKLPI
jgi:DNA-binding response OmpR family regulator